ncbi:Lon protease 2 [Rosistilla carotiformis]|uniref:Lon protease 2 n=1 Tax=Rosistilla carotiformis TaxID=2528017 RepID=A0A518JP69_9BACT|nr:LON peptidase substrate-binding domain-containing protein [Rosistilla carotiformis]QDV67350.1 Lon protease 2 [Rosistilla carotiformis]
MSDIESLTRLPDHFDGTVRLFPLPGVVSFPHVMQPLHIFEPRYCDLLTDTLAADRLIAMATLASGWEPDYEGRPALEEYACIGRIVSHTPTDDERHNILLLGIRRVRILQEVVTNQTYRMAKVEVLDDVYSPQLAPERPLLKRLLLEEFRKYIPESALAQENFSQLLDSQMPLGIVSDIIAYTVGIPVARKLQLLAELDVDQRAKMLIAALSPSPKQGDACGPENTSLSSGFPPPFSRN